MLSRVGWLSSLVLVSSTAWALDEALPHYEKVSGISGSLLSVGSDTLAGMTTLWVEEFQAITLQSMRKCKPRVRQLRRQHYQKARRSLAR